MGRPTRNALIQFAANVGGSAFKELQRLVNAVATAVSGKNEDGTDYALAVEIINPEDIGGAGMNDNIALTVPAESAVAITPDDETDLGNNTRALMVNVAGDVVVDFVTTGESITLTLAAGVVYPLRVKRVRATGTTATGITALY